MFINFLNFESSLFLFDSVIRSKSFQTIEKFIFVIFYININHIKSTRNEADVTNELILKNTTCNIQFL